MNKRDYHYSGAGFAGTVRAENRGEALWAVVDWLQPKRNTLVTLSTRPACRHPEYVEAHVTRNGYVILRAGSTCWNAKEIGADYQVKGAK